MQKEMHKGSISKQISVTKYINGTSGGTDVFKCVEYEIIKQVCTDRFKKTKNASKDLKNSVLVGIKFTPKIFNTFQIGEAQS